jgi:hypothetical protein
MAVAICGVDYRRCWALLLLGFGLLPNVVAALPEQCLQLPERSQACPHLIYKKSKVAVSQTATKVNEIICICLSDFEKLVPQAKTQIAKIEQQVELKLSAQKLSISEQDLILLLRK